MSSDLVMGLMLWSSNPGRGKRFLASPKHLDRIWGPPSLILIGYQGISQGGSKAARECS
jgi:hypothetical protein